MQARIVKIDQILEHPNAERLEIAVIKGWNCIVGKGSFKAGDLVIYIALDSVLTQELEHILLGESKMKLDKGRVRASKIRGTVSYGLVVNPQQLNNTKYQSIIGLTPKEDTDVSDILEIKKFEPDQQGVKIFQFGRKTVHNMHFRKYTDIDRFQNNPNVFKDGDNVVVTEKIHGISFRCGYVPKETLTWIKKIKKWFGVMPDKQFIIGSRNIQIDRIGDKTIYEKIAKQYGLKELLASNGDIVIYGEIYGANIQANYAYGLQATKDKPGTQKLVIYDIMYFGRWINHNELVTMCEELRLDTVPILYVGPYSTDLLKLDSGPSVLDPKTPVREGIVIRSRKEEQVHIGRKMLKKVSDDYSLAKNTDYH